MKAQKNLSHFLSFFERHNNFSNKYRRKPEGSKAA